AAKVKANAPWSERQQGARAGLRDAQAELQAFTAEHVRELAVPIEERGRVAVNDMADAAQQLLDARARRGEAEQDLGRLLRDAGHAVRPGDVGPFSRSDVLIREAQRLVLEGEPAPTLRVAEVQAVA